MKRKPSVKSIAAAFKCTVTEAKQVRKVLDQNTRFYDAMRSIELLNQKANFIGRLTFGVECVRGDDCGGYWQVARLLFLNTGDTYAATFVFDCHSGNVSVTSMGDYVEWLEKNGEYIK
jgi:hypothetical protein